MMRLFYVIVFWLTAQTLFSQDVRIGLFTHLQFAKSTFTARGEYDVFANGDKLFTLRNGQVADVSCVSGKLHIWFGGKSWKPFFRVEFVPRKQNTQFQLQPYGTKKNGYLYEGTLLIMPDGSRLKPVNILNIEHYVAGVIEAEAGGGELLEYYKVQAIISRTYALNNTRKHEAEGFQLCDGTHCQVYHGLPRREDLAIAAVAETRELVVVDSEINLITAAFHSNCGGQTVNAGDVWSKQLPYLVSRPDSFCIAMSSSKWEKCFSKDEWDRYVNSKSELPDSDLYVQLDSRRYFQVDSCSYIRTVEMRHDLKLRSTLFDVHPTGDKINLFGRGFGHGVGLCQEGAMQMANQGYSFRDIIHFYYKDVHIIPLRRISFFRDDSFTDGE